MDTESDHKKSQRTNRDHVNTCLESDVQQHKDNKRTYKTAQKEKVKFGEALYRNAFMNQNIGQNHLHYQRDFSLLYLRHHYGIYFSKSSQ